MISALAYDSLLCETHKPSATKNSHTHYSHCVKTSRIGLLVQSQNSHHPCMIGEYIGPLNRMYVYGLKQSPELLRYFEKGTVKTEKVGCGVVHHGIPALRRKYGRRVENDLNKHALCIRCKHGAEFKIRASKSFLREGWEELLDCWTCCQNEANVLLGKKVTIGNEAVLTSDFYMYIPSESFPGCCRVGMEERVNKLFYNQIEWKVPHGLLVFRYFDDLFERKNSFLFDHATSAYEVKFFHRTSLYRETGDAFFVERAIKVGIKKTKRPLQDSGNINRYFKDKIYRILQENSTEIEIFGYKVCFIPENTDKDAEL